MDQPLDAVRQLIVDQLPAVGETLASASKYLGRNHAYLQQFVDRGIPAELKEPERIKLAKLLKVDEELLRGAETLALKTAAESLDLNIARREDVNARIAGPANINFKVPAFGHAEGGKNGEFVLNGNRIADILAPASLAGIKDAYAVYVSGTSMEPRYEPGEAVFVNPGLAFRKGNYVVAQIVNPNEGEPPLGYVKRFISLNDDELRLEQLNPRKFLKFPRKRVVKVHRIIMGGDG